MRPVVKNIRKRKQSISIFRGINRSVNTAMSKLSSNSSSLFMEFKDTKNVTLDDYPAIRTRDPRLMLNKAAVDERRRICSNILACDEGIIRYEDDGYLHIGLSSRVMIAESSDISAASATRELVEYGTKIIVMPDKLIVSLADLSVKKMENSQISNSSVPAERFKEYTLRKVALHTSVRPSGNAEIMKPSDEAYNLFKDRLTDKEAQKKETEDAESGFFSSFSLGDTLEIYNTPSSLYMVTQIESNQMGYYNDRVLSFTQIYNTYTRITREGIGRGFAVDDWVKIKCDEESGLNSSFKILEVGEDYITINYEIESSKDATGKIEVHRILPCKMDFIVSCDNRLWGCSSKHNTLYACKLGDPTNWQAYGDGIASDSYFVELSSEGDFTAALAGKSAVYFFKENCIHRIYGTKPRNYTVTTYADLGVKKGSARSVAYVNDILFYFSPRGVCKYSFGGEPLIISDNAFGEEIYESAVAGRHKDKYMICLESSEGFEIMSYDTRCGQWLKEDSERFDSTVCYRGSMYYSYSGGGYIGSLDDSSDNLLRYEASVTPDKEELEPYLLKENSEEIEWKLESGDLYDAYAEYKYIQKIELILEIISGDVSLWLSKDRNPYEKVWERHITRKQGVNIPVHPGRCSNFRIKLCGKGKTYLYGVTLTTEEGSGTNGRIQP